MVTFKYATKQVFTGVMKQKVSQIELIHRSNHVAWYRWEEGPHYLNSVLHSTGMSQLSVMPIFPPDDVDMWSRIEGKQGDSAGGRCSEPVRISSLGEMQGQVYRTQLLSLMNLMDACVFYVCLLGRGYVGPKWGHNGCQQCVGDSVIIEPSI